MSTKLYVRVNDNRQAYRRVVGGDFELQELRLGGPEMLHGLTHGITGTWTTSGRGALCMVLRILQSRGARRMLLPSYLCSSVVKAVKASGLEYSFYLVNEALQGDPDPRPGDVVLVIHYFGWLNPASERLRAGSRPECYLIDDACQALLSNWMTPEGEKRFIILSPRKFGPTVLGGWCNLRAKIESASHEIETLVWRSLAARLVRGSYLIPKGAAVDGEVEEFYMSAFHDMERYLDAHPAAQRAPELVRQLIAGMDWESAARRRRENWRTLHEALRGKVETLFEKLPGSVVPIGYPIRLRRRDDVRARLAAQRIFCPVHWSLPHEVNPSRFPGSARLSRSCLTLPVDQRYKPATMNFMADILKKVI